MVWFARICGGANWDSITEQTPEDLTFPSDVLADILDAANEVSVWEVESSTSADVEILAAALHSPHANRLNDVTFRFVSDWRLGQLGLGKHQTNGDSVDGRLKGKHWVIEVATVAHLIKLAKAFAAQPERSFSEDAVMRRFAKSIEEKRILPKRITPELWNKIIEGQYLKTVVGTQSVAAETPEGAKVDKS